MYSLVAGRHDVWREIQAIDRGGGAKIGAIPYLAKSDISTFREGDILMVGTL